MIVWIAIALSLASGAFAWAALSVGANYDRSQSELFRAWEHEKEMSRRFTRHLREPISLYRARGHWRVRGTHQRLTDYLREQRS